MMTIAAVIPIPTAEWVVLATDQAATRDGELVKHHRKIVAHESLPVAMTTAGTGAIWHPEVGEWLDAGWLCDAALAQIATDERTWTMDLIAKSFAAAFAPSIDESAKRAGRNVIFQTYMAGCGPAEAIVTAYDVTLRSGHAPAVRRLVEPYIHRPPTLTLEQVQALPTWKEVKGVIENACLELQRSGQFTLSNHLIARRARKLLEEAIMAERASTLKVWIGGDVDVAVITRTRVEWR